MNIAENIDNYNVIKKQTDKLMIKNKVFEENDKRVRENLYISKGSWERMTISVSIYDYIMKALLIYVITSAISYWIRVNDAGYVFTVNGINCANLVIIILSFLSYLIFMVWRYERNKWKMDYTGKYHLKFVIMCIESIIILVLLVVNIIGLYFVSNTLLLLLSYITIGISLYIISITMIYLYRKSSNKHKLKVTISKGIVEQDEKEQYKDDILINGGITFILHDSKRIDINFEEVNIYLNNRKDLIIYKGDSLIFDNNCGATIYKETDINELVLKTIVGTENRLAYQNCF